MVMVQGGTFWIGQLIAGARKLAALAALVLAMLIPGGLSHASEVVRQFAQEFLEHEARQMRQPTPAMRYADGEPGKAMRAIFAPDRVAAVVDSWFDAKQRGDTGLPDVMTLLNPYVTRYQKAFAERPRDYAEEYLDAMFLSAQVLRRTRAIAKSAPELRSPNGGDETQVWRQLMESSAKLMDTVTSLLQRTLLRQLAEGMFAPELIGKVLRVHAALSPPPPPQQQPAASPPSPSEPPAASSLQNNLRVAKTGKQVYAEACAGCHTHGVFRAPKLGDDKAWAPHLRTGLDIMVRNTLRGVGAMPAQGGGDFHDVEIARAVVYLANAAGATYEPPQLPGRQTMVSTGRGPAAPPQPVFTAKSYVAMNLDEKLRFGQALYASNCASCHGQDAQGSRLIPSLVNAPLLMDPRGVVEAIVRGYTGQKPARVLPRWNRLGDEEITALANFLRQQFSGEIVEMIEPADVSAMRQGQRQ